MIDKIDTLHSNINPSLERTQKYSKKYLFLHKISKFISCLDGDCGAWSSDVGLVASGHRDDGEAVGGPRLHVLLDKVKLVPWQP